MSHDTERHSPRRRALVAGLLGASLGEAAQPAPPVSVAVRWDGPHRRGSGWLEWRLAAPADGSNRFDPAQHDPWCEFKGPTGRTLRVTAFWLGDAQGGCWVLRLLPPQAGRWMALPQARLAGAAARPLGMPFAFEVTALVPHQHIGLDPQNPRYFAFDDGSPFVPVGINLCWGVGPQPLDDYRRWMARLAANGGNFIRLWMASWAFGIEWQDTGLGDYGARMERAAQLDAVFELAESLGIRIMLCLLNHGAFTERNDAEWARNPYNRALGGPLAAPEDFVTDAAAQALFERRLRYIAARWSHSPALHSWEWWNEVTWTPINTAALRPWFQRMNRVLDAHDPYRRLRSTSWADRGDTASWQLPELDYAQQHDYTPRDPLLHYADAARAWAADGITTKPLLPGELGLRADYDPQAPRPFNFEAVHLHNGLWAPLFHGYAGSALYWWWDHMVDPQNVWPAYRGVARFLQALHKAGLKLAGHRPHPAQVMQAAAQALALAGPHSLLLWLRADLHDASTLQRAWREQTGGSDAARPWQPRYPRIDGGRVRLAQLALADGPLRVSWFDAGSGEPVAHSQATVRAGILELDCPPFQQDLAAIVRRG